VGDLPLPWFVACGVAGVLVLLAVVWATRQRILALDESGIVAELRKRVAWRWPKRVGLWLLLALGAAALRETWEGDPGAASASSGVGTALVFVTFYAWFEWDTHWTMTRLDEIDAES
jgi:hypothetical protein